MKSGESKVRIGISGSYGGLNLGDEAILEGILLGIRESLDAEVTVYTRDEENTMSQHDVERAVNVRDLTREDARREIARLDVFILGGGGILYDRDAELYLREAELAQESGVPVMVYAVSAGPLEQPSVRQSIRERLNQVDLITVRDRLGKRLLEEVGVEREIVVTADPALLLSAEEPPEELVIREGLDRSRRLVAFSVREPGPAAPDIDVDHYHGLVANAADFVIDRLEADVAFIPMERAKMDLQHSHAVISMMQHADRATVLREEYTPAQMIGLIGRFEFTVGMRLHFLIFSALANVPFVALPYASKVTGLIEDLDMEMPPLQDVNAGRLIATIDRSWDYRKRIRNSTQKTLPGLQARARQTHELLLDLLNKKSFESKSRREHASAQEAY